MTEKIVTHQASWGRFLNKPLGSSLLAEEKKVLHPVWDRIFGDFLCALCLESQMELTKEAQFRHRVLVSFLDKEKKAPSTDSSVVDRVYTRERMLPFLPNSVDAFFLPHVLEFLHRPQILLRQVQEALKFGGHVVIVGFNPWSLMSIVRWFKDPTVFTPMTFRSVQQIHRWMNELHCDVIFQKQGFYYPLHHELLRQLHFGGGVYAIVAKKNAFGITPLYVKLEEKLTSVHHGIIEPARREVPSS